MPKQTQQYSTFRLDRHLFGIEVENVQEIIRPQEVTPVPLAPPEVRGLINLRGQIVTAVDLRRRLGLPPAVAELAPMNVVLRAEQGGAVSLLVDSIGEVLEVGDETYESPPETLRGAARELIRGAYKLPVGLLLVLNLERVLDLRAERSA